ncbi:DUF2326 domain-containing protein [Brevibacillus parabrevis]|uniref:DUF2326 domain-containing protein n=1 Tax=Brevibacillus parabrevis TaxID=54914 RepID=UPI0028CFD800|nr:DUF2326 domain-containing protein [Brevibacillus parabrevis]
MIKKIYSTLSTFNEIELHKGLNILLADVTQKSTIKDTRNGLGKTTFTEIIHFLFGGNCTKNSIFKLDHFIDHYFIMDLVIANSEITVKRRGSESNYVYIEYQKESFFETVFGVSSKKVKVTEWNQFLGEYLFNLNPRDTQLNENLKFRTLFPYFSRIAKDGGFLEATKYFKTQKVDTTQIVLTYLLGLDTKLAINYKLLEEKKKEIADLKKALKTEAYKKIMNEGINLDTEITILNEEITVFKSQLANFQVHPKYKEIEIEANEYAKKIADLSNENFIDRQILSDLEASSKDEENITDINILELYNEVKIRLPDVLIKTFSDSKAFHEQLVKNRKKYLIDELEKYKSAIQNREKTIKQLSIEQSKKMEILNTHGALEQYSLLQTRLNELVNKHEMYQNQQRFITSMREEEATLKIEEQRLIIEINKSLEQHSRTKKEAILLVEEVSKSLYNSAAQLSIGQTKNGRYDIKMISRNQGSTGINGMLIYCFDMMLIQMSLFLDRKMDILIHDSTLFDPVDERQIAEALRFGKEKSLKNGFQYIVTLNSDDLPESVKDEVKDNILPVILTDSDESGSLMGVYF